MDLKKIQHLCREFLQEEPRLSTDFGPSWSLGVARARFRLILEQVDILKPNGVSHTVYPDEPAASFNEWTANFTRKEVARDADDFKRNADNLWADTYFRSAHEADDFKRKFDALWAKFKQDIQRNA